MPYAASARIMKGTLEHEGFAAIWLDHLRQAMDGLGAGADAWELATGPEC